MQTTSKTRLWKLSQTNVRMWIVSFNDRIKQWWLTQPSSRFAHLEGGVKWGPTCPTFFLACSPLCSSCKYVWRAAPPLLIHSSPTKKGIQALGNAVHWPKHFKLKFTALFPNFFYWTFHFSEAPLTWIWPLAFSGKTTLIWRIWCNHPTTRPPTYFSCKYLNSWGREDLKGDIIENAAPACSTNNILRF